VKREWEKKLGIARSRSRVICYGIGPPDETVPDDYPRESGAVDFVCVSRVVRWKGHKQLLETWRLARDKVAERIRLVIVGDGPALRETIEFARHLDLNVSDATNVSRGLRSPDTIFLGGRECGARYFNGGDVGILLSIEPEAFGLVLLEAMCRRKPVVASRLGGIVEVVEDGKSGYLVDPFDSETAAEAICRLADSPQRRSRMGRHGCECWENHFTAKRMLNDYAEYFKRKC